jgi:hypothetical protein
MDDKIGGVCNRDEDEKLIKYFLKEDLNRCNNCGSRRRRLEGNFEIYKDWSIK